MVNKRAFFIRREHMEQISTTAILELSVDRHLFAFFVDLKVKWELVNKTGMSSYSAL